MIRIKSDRIVMRGGLFDGYIYIDGGVISDVSARERSAEKCYDFSGKYVSPGFIDMHTHGAGGHAFMNSSANEVALGCNFHLLHGTTSILPTVATGTFETMKKAVRDIAAAKESGNVLSNIIGAHLEGPYISKNRGGAQCADDIRPPQKREYEALVAEYGKYISRWTYAPECDEGGEFCKFITSRGILSSAGHTDATYDDMMLAIDSGCRLITHIYSCVSTLRRDHGMRTLGVIETAFLRDDLYVEMIGDGVHLPPELVKMIVKIKGTDRSVLVTDSLDIAGTDIERGEMNGTKFIVEDGVCKLADRSALAGSIATTDRVMRVMTQMCGYDVPTAIEMMCGVPAKLLGLKKGEIRKGYDADIAVFDDDINILSVFVGGKKAI